MSREQALDKLFAESFDQDELRRWLGSLPDGRELLDELPAEAASYAELRQECVALLERNKRPDAEFFLALLAERPRRAAEIKAVAELWEVRGLPTPSLPRRVAGNRVAQVSFALGILVLGLVGARALWWSGRGLTVKVERCSTQALELSVINPDRTPYVLTQREFSLIVAGQADPDEQVKLRFDPGSAVEPGVNRICLVNALPMPFPYEPGAAYRVALDYQAAVTGKHGTLRFDCDIVPGE